MDSVRSEGDVVRKLSPLAIRATVALILGVVLGILLLTPWTRSPRPVPTISAASTRPAPSSDEFLESLKAIDNKLTMVNLALMQIRAMIALRSPLPELAPSEPAHEERPQ